MTRPAHNIRRTGLAVVKGEHLVAANHALPLTAPPALPRRVKSEREVVHQARIAAVRRLGTGWVLHPAYQFNPRHSNNPDVYGPPREAYLDQVRQAAAAARAGNPMWRTAQRVRAALED